jgi:hypothetical protein
MRRLAKLFILLLPLACCGTYVTFTRINPAPRMMVPRSPESVELYASGPPTRLHVDVAILEVEQTRSLNERGTNLMIDALRAKAGQIGCDAIVLGSVADHQGAAPGSGWSLLDPGSRIRQASCLMYTDLSPGHVIPSASATAQTP